MSFKSMLNRKSPMFYENLIIELTTSFEENCCDYDNTQSTQSVENIIKDFLSAVNTFYDGERLSIIIGKRYPALIHKVYKIINDCNLITMTTESDGIKLYNRKTGRVFGY